MSAKHTAFRAAVTLLALTATAATAQANVHGDVGVSGGVARRFLGGGDGDAKLGPMVQVTGHLAFLPLLRVGAYVSHDASPNDGPAPARQITSLGLHLQGVPPLFRGDFRMWIFAGFGYARVYAPSYHQTLTLTPDGQTSPVRQDVLVEGSGGGHFDVPIGIGAGYRVRKPLEITAELGTRLGFGFTGSVYDGRAAVAPNFSNLEINSLGKDRFALFLTVGVRFDL